MKKNTLFVAMHIFILAYSQTDTVLLKNQTSLGINTLIINTEYETIPRASLYLGYKRLFSNVTGRVSLCCFGDYSNNIYGLKVTVGAQRTFIEKKKIKFTYGADLIGDVFKYKTVYSWQTYGTNALAGFNYTPFRRVHFVSEISIGPAFELYNQHNLETSIKYKTYISRLLSFEIVYNF